MKILLLHNYYLNRGGEDIYFDSLKMLLRSKGNDVNQYTKDNKYLNKSNLKDAAKVFHNSKVEMDIRKIISDFKPEIAHIHNLNPQIPLSVYKILRDYKIPVVQTIHSYKYFCVKSTLFRNGKICELCVHRQFALPSIVYSCYHGSKMGSVFAASALYLSKQQNINGNIDFFIFPSRFTRDYYLKNSAFSESRCKYLPHFTDSPPESGLLNPEKKYFIFVGRLAEEKGILDLLTIFTELPKLKLVVIGTGELENKVKQYKKYKNISFLGHLKRNKIYSYLKNAVCTVIPSLWYETGPIVLIESFANSTPVIVPDSGSFKAQVTNNKTGLVYKQGNPEDLKRKIIYAAAHKKLMVKMGVNSGKVYSRTYSADKHYSSLMKIYVNLINNKNGV